MYNSKTTFFDRYSLFSCTELFKPNISDLYTERLTEKNLILYHASVAGFNERYRHGETTHTIHVWWARRPHSAMRALIFATLCKEVSEESFQILCEIGASPSVSGTILNKARQMLLSQYKEKPKLLDMFGGGGTIPFEAMQLGADAYAVDSNELSVFIQRSLLAYSQNLKAENTLVGSSLRLEPTERLEPTIHSILKNSGERVLNNLTEQTDILYPLRHSSDYPVPYAYLWSYSLTCPKCNYKYFLVKRAWLSKKKGKIRAFTSEDSDKEQILSFQTVDSGYKYPSVWKRGTVICPRCKHIKEKVNVKECRDEMTAMIRPSAGKNRGKEFMPPTGKALPDSEVIKETETRVLSGLNAELPDSELPIWSGIINPAIYGMKSHADIFNPRQRVVMLLLIKALKDEYCLLLKKESENTARYIISLLSGFIDQLVDWNCRLSIWIPQNEQVGRAFCGPGVSMIWDYAETDPLLSGPANLWDKLERIVKGASSIKGSDNKVHIFQGFAQNLPFEENYFDAVVTDPPYYDNLYYSLLADFFFVWKKMLLKEIEPELFQNRTTHQENELVASKYRNRTSFKAHEAYCKSLSSAVKEAARVLKSDGILSFIYTHSSVNGWEAFVRAFKPSCFYVTGVQPLNIERRERPRAMRSQAINTCIAFVFRKCYAEKSVMFREDIIKMFESLFCCDNVIYDLKKRGWNDKECGITLFANGAALLINFRDTENCCSISESLIQMEKILRQRFPEFKIVNRKSM